MLKNYNPDGGDPAARVVGLAGARKCSGWGLGLDPGTSSTVALDLSLSPHGPIPWDGLHPIWGITEKLGPHGFPLDKGNPVWKQEEATESTVAKLSAVA